MNKHLDLFLTFFKIGAFTFGGGYAMLPLIKHEASEKHGWISDEEMLDIVAISESTPGPIAINSATFVGYRTAGVTGAACATLGVVLPSFLVIALLGTLLDAYSSLKWVKYAFFGIKAGVLALICKAVYSMYKACPKGVFSYIIMGLSFALVCLAGISSIYVLLLCAGAGLAFTALEGRQKK